MDVSCPQCGNPNLDVDAANNVVYCKKCGFAVQVDPATGNVTPISQGGGAGAAPVAGPAPAQAGGAAKGKILGLDSVTVFLAGEALLAIMLFSMPEVLDFAAFAVFSGVWFLYYLWHH